MLGKIVRRITEEAETLKEEFLLEVDTWFQVILTDKLIFLFKTLPYIIKTNIDLLIFFNKNRCYFHWDYEYMYELMIWKMKHMRDTLRSENIIADVDEVCSTLEEAIKQWEIYKDPETVVKAPDSLLKKDVLEDILQGVERSKEEADYYRQLYKTEQDAWDTFHDILKANGQRWWD